MGTAPSKFWTGLETVIPLGMRVLYPLSFARSYLRHRHIASKLGWMQAPSPQDHGNYRRALRSPLGAIQRASSLVVIEPFSSWLCFAELQNVDRFGELAGFPGAAA